MPLQKRISTVAQSFVGVASNWSLTVSLIKTKGMNIGNELSFVDGVPVCGQSMEMVNEFPYLGSTITSDGEVDTDVKIRIAKAASAFGNLRKSIFTNQSLSVDGQRAIYKAVVLATLFHHQCVRCILTVTHHQQ